MVTEIEPKEAARRLRGTSAPVVLLDVREEFERETARIEPSLHIPMNEVAARVAEIPRDGTLIVYCHGGARSAMVAGFLQQQGFKDVLNLRGGIDAWSREVDPKVPRYG